MKFYSEKLDKLFDDVEILNTEEKAYDAQKAEEEATKKLEEKKVSDKKKKLAAAIEEADKNLDKAYEDYEEAKKKCQIILEESNERMTAILDEAKENLAIAQEEKTNALMEFNKEFGAFKVSYTGERADKEWERISRIFPSLFFRSPFYKF